MASLNKTFIMGRLGQDPELRYTQSQVPVVTLNVATTEVWTRDGQKKEQTEWHRVVVWSRQAENCAKYLSKGSAVFVEGKLQTRSWEDKSGQKKYITEISANNVQFMPSGSNQGGSSHTSSTNEEASTQNSNIPNSFPPAQDNTPSSTLPTNDSLDDIPF